MHARQLYDWTYRVSAGACALLMLFSLLTF